MATRNNLRQSMNSTNDVIEALKTTIDDSKDGKVNNSTIIRLVVLVIAWINQIAVTFGCYEVPNISQDAIYLIATTITIAITVVSYWKNNSWTSNAKTADAILDLITNSGITSEDISEALINLIGKDDDECNDDSQRSDNEREPPPDDVENVE